MPKNTYLLKDGTPVPGTTTICNQLDKPQLVNWAWKLGLEGKDWKEERDSAGNIGTVVHACVIKFFGVEEIDLTDKVVAKCFGKFLSWWYDEGDDAKMVIAETPLVSEKLAFGGQPDLYVKINGKNRLIDVKTSSGIYESHWLQLAGYDILLRENGYKVDEYQILWLPKHDGFACPIRTSLNNEKKIFKNLLEIYRLRKEIEH